MPKKKGDGEVTQVRATGDWSADSKLSAITNGYWDDPYFERFNGPPPPAGSGNSGSIPNRTSLICRGYTLRFKLCDWALSGTITDMMKRGKFQIVCLGAGMDTLYFRLVWNRPNIRDPLVKFCDVDFPSVIEKKVKILSEHPDIMDLAGGAGDSRVYYLIPGDLRSLPKLQEDLVTIAGLDPEVPTIFYSECVVNYLKPEENNNILLWIRSIYKEPIWIAYEQCLPFANRGFYNIMLEHFNKNGCPLLAMEKYGTSKEQVQQLKNVFGKNSCKIANFWDWYIYEAWNGLLFRDVNPNHQFDEYEALVGTSLHYSVRIAGPGLNFHERNSSILENVERHVLTSTCDSTLSFTGHSSVVLKPESNQILIIGGTDESSGYSNSIQGLTVTLENGKISCSSYSPMPNETQQQNFQNQFKPRTHCKTVYSKSTNKVYIFGGRKSPSCPSSNDLIILSLSSSSNSINEIEIVPAGKLGPSPRWRHDMVLVPFTENEELLYLFGGKNNEKTFGDVWIFYTKTKSWALLALPEDSGEDDVPSPRHSHAMTYSPSRNSIFITGGFAGFYKDDLSLSKDSMWEFNLDTKDFRLCEPEGCPMKAGHNLCCFGNETLILVGGYPYEPEHMSDMVIIDLVTETFILYNFAPEISNSFLPFGMTSHILNFKAGYKEEEYLCVFGGGGNCFSFGTHFNKSMIFVPLSQFEPNVPAPVSKNKSQKMSKKKPKGKVSGGSG